MTSEIKVDTISEQTSANGVTIDGLTIKDGNIIGDVALAGTTPTFTIGDAGAEDAALIFDGNAQDFYIALDDSADDLIIGLGAAVGTTPMLSFTEAKAAAFTGAVSMATTLTLTGNADFNGDLDVDGTTNLDVVDIDGAVNMATTALVTGVLTTTAATVFNGGFTSNDGCTITTADNTSTLSLVSTDADASVGPNLVLYRNSGSPAVDDHLGKIAFQGENDADQILEYFSIRTYISDETDGTEDGHMQIVGKTAGADKKRLDLTPTEAVFNDDSLDIDFRVESNGNANMLKVDAGNDRVGIGTGSPATQLHLANTAGIELRLDADTNNSGQEDCFIKFSTDGGGQLGIAGMDNNNSSTLFSGNTENAMVFGTISNLPTVFATNNTERMQITAAGILLVGTTSTTINSSNFGIAIGSDKQIQIARNAGGSSPCLDVYGSQGQFRVMGDGDVENTNNRIGSISDERIKQNITDANSQWVDIKAIKVRNFERKDDVAKYGAGKKVQIGVVAQEVESVSPGLVKERDPTPEDIKMSSEFGTLYTADDDIPDGKKVGDIKDIKDQVKSVGYSVLYMKAIKALQEAMTRIETLEAEVTALKG